MTALDPFDEVMMLGEWPVTLPAYRVLHTQTSPNWEEGRLRSMHAHLRSGMVLYDCGAEHADLSSLYARHFVGGNGGGVVLVEASELFWPVMRATFAANGLVPVACFAGFASDVDWSEDDRTPSWPTPVVTQPALGDPWPSWADGECVPHHGFRSWIESAGTLPSVRFDTLAEITRPPDAISLDVEGAELVVLRGTERVLRENRPLVFCSIHPTLIAHDYSESGILGDGDPDHERQRVLDYMTSLGYRASNIQNDHEEHWLFWAEELEDFDPWLGVEHLRP